MNQVTSTLRDTVSGVVALNGDSASYYPPTFENSDPIPLINRGYRFSGGQFMQLPPYTGSSSPNIFLGVTMTIEFWVKPDTVAAVNPLFSKGESVTYTKCSEILTIEINTAKNLQVRGGFPNVQIVATNSDFSTLWTYISIVFIFSGGSTQVTFYINGAQVGSTQTMSCWIRDSSSASSTLLGASYTRTSFYQGFMWQFRIFNFARTAAQVASYITGSSPIAGITLSSCSTSTYPSGCATCLASCKYGCVRAQDCILCIDPLCIVCTDFTVNSCSQCKPNAVFVAGIGCTCVNHYYYDAVSLTCLHCNTLCSTCVSIRSCSACYSNSTPVPNGACACTPGSYYDPLSDLCQQCDASCVTCSSSSSTSCLTCKANAVLSQSAPASCACKDGYYEDMSTLICMPCATGCKTCTGETNENCLACYRNAYLSNTASYNCKCLSTYYPNPTSATCTKCNNPCLICSGTDVCLSCADNSQLSTTNTCVCISGYYLRNNPSSCEACTTGCASCTSERCTQCSSGYFALKGSCYSSCPRGYESNDTLSCVEVDMSPPVPLLTVTGNNSLSVFFNKPMNWSLTSEDISVDVHSPNNLATAVKWTNPVFQGYQTMRIDLTFDSAYLLKGSTANLTFLNISKVKDEYDVVSNVTSLIGSLSAFGSPPSNVSTLLLNSQIAQQTSAATKGGIALGIAASVVNGSPSGFMSLINQLQLISYIGMTKLPLPDELASTLAAINVGLMLPNPLSGDLDKMNETSQEPPDYVGNYGIESTLFVSNALVFIGTCSAVLLSFVPIYLLSKVKNGTISTYFGSMLPTLRWNTPLNLWLTSYLDLGVFSLLQLLNAPNSISTLYTGASLILSGLFALAFAFTPVFLLYFITHNADLILSRSDAQFNTRWGALFLQFKRDRYLSTVSYYALFTVRRLLLALTLILSQDQLGIFALLNVSFGLVVSVISVLSIHNSVSTVRR